MGVLVAIYVVRYIIGVTYIRQFLFSSNSTMYQSVQLGVLNINRKPFFRLVYQKSDWNIKHLIIFRDI